MGGGKCEEANAIEIPRVECGVRWHESGEGGGELLLNDGQRACYDRVALPTSTRRGEQLAMSAKQIAALTRLSTTRASACGKPVVSRSAVVSP